MVVGGAGWGELTIQNIPYGQTPQGTKYPYKEIINHHLMHADKYLRMGYPCDISYCNVSHKVKRE